MTRAIWEENTSESEVRQGTDRWVTQAKSGEVIREVGRELSGSARRQEQRSPHSVGEGQVWVLETGYIANPDDPIGYDGGMNTHN